MKKKIQKWLSITVTCAMMISLAACGAGDGGNGSTTGQNGGSGTQTGGSSESKEGVFTEQRLETDSNASDLWVRYTTVQNDKVYMVYDAFTYEGSSSLSAPQLFSMNLDGSDQKTVALTLYGEDEEPVESAQTSADTETTEDSESTEDTDSYSYESLTVNSCAMSVDGILYGIRNYTKSSSDEGSISEDTVMAWDLDGNLLWKTQIDPLQTDSGYSYVCQMVPMEDGSVDVLILGDNQRIMTIQKDGTLEDGKSIPGGEQAQNILSNLSVSAVKENGVIMACYYDTADMSKMYLADIDLNTGSVSETKQLSDTLAMSGMNLMTPGTDGKIAICTSGQVCLYDPDTQESSVMMDFVNSDLSITNFSTMLIIDEQHIIASYYDDAAGRTVCGLFTYVDPAEIKDKQTLTLGCQYLTYDIRNKVVEFNKTNENYRIAIKDYTQYDTMDDTSAGLTQLNSDIISGNMPDILIVNSQMPMDSYIAKGLLANVDELIQQDEELSGETYLQNVWDAYRVDGKLYYVIPSFYVYTYVGKTSLLGDRTAITMKELENIAASVSDSTSIFGNQTRDGFLYAVMTFCGNSFIDVSTGKCDFNSDYFISLLEYAKTLPETFEYDDDYWNDYDSQYRENRTLLMGMTISGIREVNNTLNGSFGEDISYVGFPTDGDNGSVVDHGTAFAISAKSANTDGAWQFVRYYLTKDYQDTVSTQEYNLPVMKSSLDALAAEAVNKPYNLDENNNKVEYDEVYYSNGDPIVLPTLTQAQVDKVVALIQSVNKSAYNNDSIMNIITEETGAYFSGQKSAQDVASVIQSRVQIYVNENR